MKNLIPFMALALVLLFGCAKEESTTTALSKDDLQKDESSVYVLNLDGDNPVWEAVALEELQITQSNSSSAVTRSNGNSVHMHGDFIGVEFSATENNGGTHGGATMNLGPFVFTTETECIIAEGNEAVYGGTITEVAGPPGPFQPGWHVAFKVIDNGQGNNASPDQFYGRIFIGPGSYCGGELFWGSPFDVPAPGSIKINN